MNKSIRRKRERERFQSMDVDPIAMFFVIDTTCYYITKNRKKEREKKKEKKADMCRNNPLLDICMEW